MIRNAAALLLAALVVSSPSTASAQIGLAVRGGTLGMGAEAAIDLAGPLVLRGGIGYSLLEPTVRMTDIDWTLELPSPWYNLGIDLYLNGAMRVGGGFLFKSEDPRIVADIDGGVTVGGREFTAAELGSLVGTAGSTARRPYALVGFGRHTSGSGLFLDLGAVWLGDPDIVLRSDGGSFADQSELDARLAQGAADLEASVGTYLRIWPILSLGARIAIG